MAPSALERRQFLRVTAVGGFALTAGCLDGLTLQSADGARVESLDRDPSFRRWIPADHDGLVMHTIPGTAGHDPTETFGEQWVLPRLNAVGMDVDAFDGLLNLVGRGVVLEGPIDRGTVRNYLHERGYEETDSHRGYRLYDWGAGYTRTVAVGDDAIVISVDNTLDLIDTGTGHGSRYHEADESFDRFSDRVGSYPFVEYMLSDDATEAVAPEHSSAYYVVDEGAVTEGLALWYGSRSVPEEAALREAFGEGVIRTDDEFVTIERDFDADEAFLDERPPVVTWGATRTEDTLTIHHVAGDPVPTDRIRLSPAGMASQEPLSDREQLRAGDAFDVSLGNLASSTLSLGYTYPNGETPMLEVDTSTLG